MKMNNTALMGSHDLRGQQNTVGNVLGDLARHIVTLHGVDSGVLIGILLLDLFIVAFDQAENAVVRGIGLAEQTAGIAIGDILLGNFKSAMRHNGFFYQVLNFLHGRAASHFFAGNLHALGNPLNLKRGQADLFIGRRVGLGHGGIDLPNIKVGFSSVSLDNFHAEFLLSHESMLTCTGHIIY